MNTTSILGFLIAGSLFVVSCKKELEPQESPATAEVAATPATPTLEMQPQQVPQQQPVQTQQPVQQQPVTATAPGMNPPHGQPNHRCDIAVGAPLNSPKGQNPNASIAQPQPQQVQPQQAQARITPVNSGATAETAPGMNPPHGQPNHRCDVAVGAPLPQ